MDRVTIRAHVPRTPLPAVTAGTFSVTGRVLTRADNADPFHQVTNLEATMISNSIRRILSVCSKTEVRTSIIGLLFLAVVAPCGAQTVPAATNPSAGLRCPELQDG